MTVRGRDTSLRRGRGANGRTGTWEKVTEPVAAGWKRLGAAETSAPAQRLLSPWAAPLCGYAAAMGVIGRTGRATGDKAP